MTEPAAKPSETKPAAPTANASGGAVFYVKAGPAHGHNFLAGPDGKPHHWEPVWTPVVKDRDIKGLTVVKGADGRLRVGKEGFQAILERKFGLQTSSVEPTAPVHPADRAGDWEDEGSDDDESDADRESHTRQAARNKAAAMAVAKPKG